MVEDEESSSSERTTSDARKKKKKVAPSRTESVMESEDVELVCGVDAYPEAQAVIWMHEVSERAITRLQALNRYYSYSQPQGRFP